MAALRLWIEHRPRLQCGGDTKNCGKLCRGSLWRVLASGAAPSGGGVKAPLLKQEEISLDCPDNHRHFRAADGQGHHIVGLRIIDLDQELQGLSR